MIVSTQNLSTFEKNIHSTFSVAQKNHLRTYASKMNGLALKMHLLDLSPSINTAV